MMVMMHHVRGRTWMIKMQCAAVRGAHDLDDEDASREGPDYLDDASCVRGTDLDDEDASWEGPDS